ncbi:MAG: chromosomal replication initiator protein DnaA [Candidatus Omnitrophica bacterium]|nr:chromosomal replication initiator protein DnaA [Candidatus Omnitrophota bacterium]
MARLSIDHWPQILELIRREVGDQTYETWFKPTRAVSAEEGRLTVETPNRFFRDWLVEHFEPIVRRCADQISEGSTQISFSIAATPPAVPERETRAGVAAQTLAALEPPARPAAVAGLNPKYTFDSIVIGSSNRFAQAAALAVGNAPAKAYNPLFIYGKVGLGKTHLLHAIGHQAVSLNAHAKILYISSEQFTNQLITAIQTRSTLKFRERYRTMDVLLIDDIPFIAGKESTQEEFFHTFNTLYDAHKQIVLCSDRSPKEIRGLEERLISRFEWGLVTDIQPPDLETRTAILRKKAQGYKVFVPDDVTAFIAERIHSNIRELEGALIRVVAYSALVGQEISKELAQEVLKEMVLEEAKRISIELIQQKVAEYYDIRLSEMRAKRRTKQVAYPRQMAMYLSRQLTDSSLPAIGESFGGRDHSTVLYACEKIEQEALDNSKTKGVVDHLMKVIRG